MKVFLNFLEVASGIVIGSFLCLLVIMFVTSCTLLQPRAKPAPVITPAEAQIVTGTIKTKHEIDAVGLVQALDEADCELVSIAYEEGKKKAAFVAKCKGAIELPE